MGQRDNRLYSVLFFLFAFSVSLRANPVEDSMRAIGAHLLLQDQEKALLQAKASLYHDPNDPLLAKIYIDTLARSCDERLWLQEWKTFKEKYPEEAYSAKLLESAAWALLERASKASSAQVRQVGLIAAGLTRDVRSIPIILKGMQDSDASIREVSIEMASLYGDAPLKKALLAAYEKERIRKVRGSLIRAFGKLQMADMKAPLLEALERKEVSTQEQCALIESLVHLSKGIDERELLFLAHSERALLRTLAAEVIAKFQLKEQAPLLWELVQDSHPVVTTAAFKAMGLLRIEQDLTLLMPYIDAKHASISIMASWVASLQGITYGKERLAFWVEEGEGDAPILAAAAITALGGYGVELADSLLTKVDDPFVRANLALALVGQRYHTEHACQVFEEILTHSKEKWMAEPEIGALFTPFKKSTLPHRRGIAHYPELMSQVIKLQMISILAILDHKGADLLLKEFLAKKNWQVTGLAAELLLGEGDPDSLSCVKALLQDKDPLIVLEAALVLAVWGRDPTTIPYLLEGYKGAKIETKVKILESLGRVKDKSTIPFLVDCMDESSYLLRIIAASILLQTMNG